jgi:hypothetical protein
MNLDKITNPPVKSAIEAWQKGDAKTFRSFFSLDAKLFDDGSVRDLSDFIQSACGQERFTSIDKVENNGLDIYGHFHTQSWGDFKTYFKFHFNSERKIDRLEIGQANY